MLKKQVNIRVEEELLNNITPILSSFGLNVADACRIFLNKVWLDKGIPFDLKYDENGWDNLNDKTKKAILSEDYEEVKDINDLWS